MTEAQLLRKAEELLAAHPELRKPGDPQAMARLLGRIQRLKNKGFDPIEALAALYEEDGATVLHVVPEVAAEEGPDK